MAKGHFQLCTRILTVNEEVYPYFAASDAVLDLVVKAPLFFVRLYTVGLVSFRKWVLWCGLFDDRNA